MAQAVVAGHHLTNREVVHLRGLPSLSTKAHDAYHTVFPDWLQQFPNPTKDQQIYIDFPENYRSNDPPWSHELRHDAESAF